MSELEQLESSARKKLAQIYDENPWAEPDILHRLVVRISSANAGQKSRRRQLVQVAERLNQALMSKATCRAGCSHCCSMTTMLYQHEAEVISRVSGKPMEEIPMRPYEVALQQARMHFGTPCPFLVDSRCSVYEVRPLVCRLHHSLNDDASACNVNVLPEHRKPVARYDVDVVEVPYHHLVRKYGGGEPWGAIQEYFPARAGHANPLGTGISRTAGL